MLFESSELLYKISFEYNGEKLIFTDKHVKETIGQVLDWLYKNKYDFKGPLHQSFGKKLLDFSDIESSPSADYYLKRMRQFYKLKGVDKYFQVVNKEPAFEAIKQMLVKFGVDESTILSEGFDSLVEPEEGVTKFTSMFPTDLKTSQSQEEEEKSKEYVKNPFRQSICILGKSGKGKSTTIDKMLDKMKNTEFEFIIPTSSTTALLSQYSPSLNKYIPSRLGKMIMSAYKNEGTYYIAVIDECHKSNVIEMINDELLQCISTYRNDRNRFISVDDETAELYKGLSLYRGNLIVPDNFGFIFLSSKPEVIIQNSDFFNRVDIYVMIKQPFKDADLSLYINEDKAELPSKYFTKISGKLEADINRIKELNDAD